MFKIFLIKYNRMKINMLYKMNLRYSIYLKKIDCEMIQVNSI